MDKQFLSIIADEVDELLQNPAYQKRFADNLERFKQQIEQYRYSRDWDDALLENDVRRINSGKKPVSSPDSNPVSGKAKLKRRRQKSAEKHPIKLPDLGKEEQDPALPPATHPDPFRLDLSSEDNLPICFALLVVIYDMVRSDKLPKRLGRFIGPPSKLIGNAAAVIKYMIENNNGELADHEIIKGALSAVKDNLSDLDIVINPKTNSQPDKVLPPAAEKAYQSYKYAVEKDSSLETDKEVYAWLERESFDGYKLPSLDNWLRYLGRGRKHYGDHKNTPRAGRAAAAIKVKDDPGILDQVSNQYLKSD
ncbi:MAG: hypothetical protein ABFD91_10700 [Anaerohalosphaeraceae bacterium]